MKKQLLIRICALSAISFLLYHCGNESPAPSSPGNNIIDTAFNAYIILSTGSTPFDTVYFTDRNLCKGSYSSSQNNTYIILNDTLTSQSISVSFNGSSTGSPVFTFGYLSYAGGGYDGNGITGTISLYEAAGGKIKGIYSGVFADASASYTVNAYFTVKRTM